MRQRLPRVHNEKHLDFVRGLPCVCCQNNIESQAAHIKFADESREKRYVGNEKPDDKWTVPLCGRCHSRQHSMNERKFWIAENINPLAVADRLWDATGDHAAGLEIIAGARA